MSGNNYGVQDFAEFMDMLGKKGLLNKTTAMSRKNAALQILEILDEEEKQDLRAIDIDHLFDRFQNLNGSRFTPDSLRTYKTRFKKGLEDFLSWRENPMSFKPNLVSKKPRQKKETDAEVLPPMQSSEAHPPITYKAALPSIDVFPIRIRDDVVVQIAHLPHDLTKAEAQKIARVIQAHVLEEV